MRIALTSLVLIIIATAKAIGAERSGTEIEGKAIFENHCARCHSIGASGESPLHEAPPLREIYLRSPIEQLSQGLAACPLCPSISDIHLLGDRQGVVNLDAKITDRALDRV